MFYPKSHFNTTPGDYKLHTYDKVREYDHVYEYNKVHEYKTIHDYNKIHEYNKTHDYNEVREYKIHDYKPTHPEPKPQRDVISRPPPQRIKHSANRKRKSYSTWPDKPIYTHTYRPYEYTAPPPLREYKYRDYEMNHEDYMQRKVRMYDGYNEYKLTPDNFPPMRWYKTGSVSMKKEDLNNNEQTVKRETSLRDIHLKEPVAPIAVKETTAATTVKTKTPVRPVAALTEENVVPGATKVPQTVTVPAVAKPAPKTEAKTAIVAKNYPVRKDSPVSAKHVYTSIGSRSPSPNMAPVGTSIVGGMIGAALINQKTEPTRVDQEQKPIKPEPTSTNNINTSNNTRGLVTAAVVGGTAGASTNQNRKTDLNSKQKKQQQPKTKVPTPEPPPPTFNHTNSLMTAAVVGGTIGSTTNQNIKTESNSNQKKQQQPKNKAPTPEPPPPTFNNTNALVTAAVVGGTADAASNQTTKMDSNSHVERKQSPPKPSSPVPAPPVKTAPVKSPAVAPVVAVAAVAPSSKTTTDVNSKEMKQKQSSQKPPTPEPTPQVKKAPEKSPPPAVVPVVAAAATKAPPKKSTPPPSIPEKKIEPTNPPQKENPPKGAGIKAANVPSFSSNAPKIKNDVYQEEPSSWSPVPPPKVNRAKGPSLPPEVIATIEAYDRAHNN